MPVEAEEVGLEGLVSYPDALRIVLEQADALAPLGDETVDLEEAAGRVLAEPVVAEEPWPRFAHATMDGYAVRAADVQQAAPDAPVRLEVAGMVVAGAPELPAVRPGACVRVMTGAPLPPGADAVVPQELVSPDGEGAVAVHKAVAPGAHVFAAGEDIRPDEVVLQPGTLLSPGAVGLLAAMGRSRVRVKRRPVLAVLNTGDEVVEIHRPHLAPGQVRNSNAAMLAAQLAGWGALPRLAGIVPDDERTLEARAHQALAEADGLVITAGMSVGTRDLVRPVLARMGVRWHVQRVAIRPGRPVAFGTWRGRPVFGLPGTPGGAMVAAELFIRPLLARWTGQAWVAPEVQGRLAAPLRMTPGRMRWVRARARVDTDGQVVAEALPRQSSSSVRSLADANALIVLPPEVEALPAGAPVRVRLLAGAGLAPPGAP